MTRNWIRCPECARLRNMYLRALHAVISGGNGHDEALTQAEDGARLAWRSHRAVCKFRQVGHPG